MNFDLTEEQELFCSTVERFAAPVDVETRRKLRQRESGYPRERWQELSELGLIALAAGEDAGGMNGSPVDLALIAEAFGKANAIDPWLENGVLPARLLEAAGADDVLEQVLSGQVIVAFAFAERGQRFNLAPSATKLSGNKLSGEKTFVMGGALADHLLVSAAGDNGTRYALVAADADGIIRHDYRIADGSIASELRFNGVDVVGDHIFALDDAALDRIVADIRLLAAAEMLGLGQRLFDETLAYVKQREQFGVAIGSFQALQHRLVDCYAALEQSKSMVYRAALSDRCDTDEWARSAAGAKAFIGDQVDRVAREAVQMHGGMGVTEELAIGHAMKRAMVLARLFGDGDAALAEYAEAA